MRWSAEVARGSWIADRLAPFGSGLITSVVPGGFDAYARVLHPVQSVDYGDDSTVRWSDVAAWSDISLRRDVQFHDIALPQHDPGTPLPWESQGPFEGSLTRHDAGVLAAIARRHTDLPEQCWFCVWDGFGWDHQVTFSATDNPNETVPLPHTVPDPIPPEVRNGPRVRLPSRDYLFYSGPVEDALAFVETQDQTANLWWPDDRAWCVASEIDLPWTYVGGSARLISEVLADPRIEALPADPEDNMQLRLTGWLADAVERCVADLLTTGHAMLDTGCGSLAAQLTRPGRFRRRGQLSVEHRLRGQTTGTSRWEISAHTELKLHAEIRRGFLHQVVALAAQ